MAVADASRSCAMSRHIELRIDCEGANDRDGDAA